MMRLLFITSILVSVLLFSCKSVKTNRNSELNNAHSQESEQDDVVKKLIQDFSANKFSETQSNQAFLIAKSYEFENKLTQAEQLLEMCNKFSTNVNVSVNLIQIKLALKKVDEAKKIAKYARVLFPNNSDILISLIEIYQIENNAVQVSNLLNEAHQKFPQNESIAILYASYNAKNAKQILEIFIKKNPNSPKAIFKLSKIYSREKNYNLALKYAHKAYFYDSDNIDCVVLIAKINELIQKYNEAEKYYKIAFQKDLENNYNAQKYINILILQKKQQEALSVLLKLEASSDNSLPFPPEFIFEIGRISILNNDFIGAKKRFESLLESQYLNFVNHDEVLFFLAYCNENLHLFQDALTALDKISVDSPLFVNAQREKVLVYINNKEDNKALELIKNFEYSKNSTAEEVIFQCSIRMYFRDHKQALALINKAIEDHSLEKELYMKRLEIYIRTKVDINTILAEAKFIVKKWPDYADGLNMLGYLLVENFEKLKPSSNLKFNDAEKFIRKALSYDKKNSYYLDSLGCFYLKKKNLNLAQKYFIESLKYSPNEPVILYHYTQVLKLLNNHQEATKNIEKARTIISNMLIYSIESDYELKTVIGSLQPHAN